MDRELGVIRVRREDLLIIILTSTKLTWLLLGFRIKTKICMKVSISPHPSLENSTSIVSVPKTIKAYQPW